MLRNEYTTQMHVPFEVVNIEEGKVSKQELPDQVLARFQGNGLDFFFLLFQSRNSFRLVLDLSTIKWFYNFDLNNYFNKHPEDFILPRNSDVNLINIVQPESLYVALDKKSVKKAPVRPQVLITLEPGYTKYELEVQPDSITLMGPSSYLREINYVNTDKLVRENVTDPIKTTISLQDFGKKNIELEPEKVQIRQLVDQIGEKVISGIPVQIKNPPSQGQVEIQPNKITVYISGGFNMIKNIDSEELDVILDLKGKIDSEKKYYTPTIRGLSNHLEVNRIEPSQIEIRYIREGNNE
ncbi:MAG: hypothetical protein K9M80_00100 [Candidatus Marinimicrobia bacterium]|nr:hypothetical protein [Candidatus Neomarinimicrobiota bacterium]